MNRARTGARKVPREYQMAWIKKSTEADIRIWIDEYSLQVKTLKA